MIIRCFRIWRESAANNMTPGKVTGTSENQKQGKNKTNEQEQFEETGR
jgi:hypothetical protein